MTDLSRIEFLKSIVKDPPASALFSSKGRFIRWLSESSPLETREEELQHVIAEAVMTQRSRYEHIIDSNDEKSVLVHVVPVVAVENESIDVIVSFFNMSGIEDYQHNAQLLDAAIEMIEEAVVITDAKNRIIHVNGAFQKLTGYLFSELEGQNPSFLSSGITSEQTYQKMWLRLLSVGHWSGEILDRRKDGSIYPKWLSVTAIRNHEGAIINFIGVFTDISKEKEAEKTIDTMAHYDPLTQLPNRNYIKEHLIRMAPVAESGHYKFSLLLIDLDRFKWVNDSLGHTAGDRLIIQTAERISQTIRKNDIVARLGGDEFLLVLSVESSADAIEVAEKILEVFTHPYVIDGTDVYTSVSIGISFFPTDGETVDTAIQHAESAMYAAKKRGGKSCEVFNPLLNETTLRRVMIENDLQRAIANEEFHLLFQPQIDPMSGKIMGVEALIRWVHPIKGFISPVEFIPIAEETGLILPLGIWIIREAIGSLKRWLDEGLEPIRVAINISARQFAHPDFAGIVKRSIDEFQIPPHLVELEVTESAVMDDPYRAIQICEELQAFGVEFAIDDFGTGYSSLEYLKLFPVKRLKIDKTFIDDIGTQRTSSTLAEVIIGLANSLRLEAVAEGVETKEQLEFLKERGCDLIQGFYYSPPKDYATILSYLRDKPFENTLFSPENLQ